MTKEEKEERKKRADLMAKLYVLPIALEIAPAIDRVEGAPLDEAFEAAPSLREIMLLSLCDIISVCSAAIDAKKKNMLGTDREENERFGRAIAYVKRIAISKVRTADALWTVMDEKTKSPFSDDGTILLFSERKLADSLVRRYAKRYGRTTLSVAEIPGNEIMRFLGRAVYARGAKRFTVNRGDAAHLVITARGIAVHPDLSAVPEGARPVMNPDVFRAAAELKQEIRPDGTVPGLKELGSRLDEALRHATLLVPVEKGVHGMGRTVSRLTGKIGMVTFPTVEINGAAYQPAFTDWAELQAVFPLDRYGAAPMALSDLASTAFEQVVINPATLGIAIRTDRLRRLSQ